MRTTRVKICGITNKNDLQSAINAGADAVGFILGVKSSPRNLKIKEAKELICQVPLFVDSVVVTVSENLENIMELGKKLHPTTIQIHGNLSNAEISSFKESLPNLFLIRSIRANPENVEKKALKTSKYFDAILLDSYIKGKYGGTGVVHDWDLSLKIKMIIDPIPMILAGGLTPENVENAIGFVRPYAVDVSSGVEKEPGIKDELKIINFIKRAKGC